MGAWIYGGLGVIIIGLGIAAWGESQHIDVLDAQNSTLRADLSTAQGANAEQVKTIGTLTAANTEWARKAKEGAEKQATAAQELITARQARAVTKAQLAALEVKDRTSVSCEALLKTDLASVCPNIAAAARERAK